MEEPLPPIQYDFPVTAYYKGHILNGHTLTRTGSWWTAILLINDPRTQKPLIALYRWQKSKDGWKTRKRFSFRRTEEVNQALAVIQEYAQKLQ